MKHSTWTQKICLAFIVMFNLLAFAPWRVAAVGQTLSGKPAVVDQANIFTDEQEQSLAKEADRLAQRLDMDVVIVTTDNTENKSSMAYADDYFDYNGYGSDEKKSGVLYLIDMDNRNAWISTTGRGIDAFTDARIDKILDSAFGPLSQGHYAKSASVFISEADRLVGPRRFQIKHGLVGLVAAFAAFCMKFFGSRSRYVKKAQSWNYDLTKMAIADFPVFNTVMVDQSVTRTYQPRQVSSGGRGGGGGSSTHTGSSGTTHGGGGRSF